MKEKLREYFESVKEEMLEDLAALVEIPGVNGEEKPDAPFGDEPKKTLLKMLEIGKRDGFITYNADNYAGEIDFNEKETALGILCHLDVVPAGDGWNTDPFKVTLKDGFAYGRGTSDDKGPLIGAYYAMKALKHFETDLPKNVRLIIGTDEETGSRDMEYYRKVRQLPPMIFTPDSSFPVTNLEKGRFTKSFTCPYIAGDNGITEFDSGIAANAVPSTATATVKGISAERLNHLISEVSEKTGVSFDLTSLGEESFKIFAEGTGAHASTPEKGNNALTALVLLLSRLRDIQGAEIFESLSELFPHGVTDGSGLGIKMQDDISGELTNTLDMLNIKNGILTGVFDTRVPLCGNRENVALKAEIRLKETGFSLSDTEMVPAHYVDENSDFVKKLLKAYEDVTGEKGYCEAIGGGTYVHEMDGGVAFGAIMPWRDTNMHGANEYIPVDELISAAVIFALAIKDICAGE